MGSPNNDTFFKFDLNREREKKKERANLVLNPKLQSSLSCDRTTWPKGISECRRYLEYNFDLHPLMCGP